MSRPRLPRGPCWRPFPAIAAAIDATLARCTAGDPADVDAILALDAEARVHAGAACAKLGGKAA